MRYETVIFKRIGAIELAMRIFRPEANRVEGHGTAQLPAGQRPGIVLFVCGGWNNLSMDKAMAPATYFAARGAVCFITQVRVKSAHDTTPTECVIDAKSAVRWVRSHATEYGVDPRKIVCTGGSAGGHVSACTATIEEFNDPTDDITVSAKPNAVAIFCPALVIYHTEARINRFGGAERARALSPILHVDKDTPPFLIQHGEDDNIVIPEEAVLFKKEMDQVGAYCELYLYPREGHGCHNYFDGKNGQFYLQYRRMDRFLSSLHYLKMQPTIDSFPFEQWVPGHAGIEG